jgi:hypothetical protein
MTLLFRVSLIGFPRLFLGRSLLLIPGIPNIGPLAPRYTAR